ncbi:MAG: hypothetical protein AB8H86_23955 [Polyangiales bacterium]
MIWQAQKGAISAAVVCIFCLSCGARTGLSIPEGEETEETDAGRDAGSDDDLRDATVQVSDSSLDTSTPYCLPFDSLAGGADLDIFILMDFSASMDRQIEFGSTKKDAVTNAVEAFVNEESSRGLRVSLTFFPFDDSDYPQRCRDQADCDGQCILGGVCRGEGPQNVCEHDSHCETGQHCQLNGSCPGEFPFGGACVEGQFCGPEPLTPCRLSGRCENPALCGVESYLTPAVAVSVLPQAARPIVQSLRSRRPGGTTPTLPALEGIIEQARVRSRSRPERTVVVLLATDGLPSSCDSSVVPGEPATAIEGPELIAAEGVADGIMTYVIGVFDAFEEADARENLTRLAIAGGTNEASIITTTSAVSDEFLEELNRLRRSLRTCAYSIPAPGRFPRAEDVEVRLVRETSDGERPVRELRAVPDASACDATLGGFYFREDGQPRPSALELCPSSCATALAPDVRVRIRAICSE